MFTRFVCALLSFCACKFPAKYETQEPRKFIVERTSYASTSYPIMDLRRAKEILLEVILLDIIEGKKSQIQNCVSFRMDNETKKIFLKYRSP